MYYLNLVLTTWVWKTGGCPSHYIEGNTEARARTPLIQGCLAQLEEQELAFPKSLADTGLPKRAKGVGSCSGAYQGEAGVQGLWCSYGVVHYGLDPRLGSSLNRTLSRFCVQQWAQPCSFVGSVTRGC